MLEKPAREIVEADLAEKITSDLLQQTQNHQRQQRQHISRFLIPSVSSKYYRWIIYGGRLVWRYILLLDRGDCNYRLGWVNHKGRESLKVRCVRWITASVCTERRSNSVELETSAASVSATLTQTLQPLTHHKHTHSPISHATAATPALAIPSVDFTAEMTSVYWAWLTVTDLFLPFEQRKALPARPLILSTAPFSCQVGMCGATTAECSLARCWPCLKQYEGFLKGAIAIHKTARMRHNILKHYHKEMWCLKQPDGFVYLVYQANLIMLSPPLAMKKERRASAL